MRPIPLEGYVVGEPKTEVTQSGYTVIRFSISSPARFKKDPADQNKKWYSFFDIVYWPTDKIEGNIQREVAKVVKGARLSFWAEPLQDRWEQDGNKRSRVVFQVDGFLDVMHHIGGKKQEEQPAAEQPSYDDDVPF